MSLTTVMVAMLLAGLVAVSGTRLATGMFDTANTLQLKDTRETILEFYSSLLQTQSVLKCLSEDNDNSLGNHLWGVGNFEGEISIELKIPNEDCDSNPSRAVMIPKDSGVLLKNSMLQEDPPAGSPPSPGWWHLTLDADLLANRVAEFKLGICLDKDNYEEGGRTVPKSMRYICPEKKTRRFQYSKGSLFGRVWGGGIGTGIVTVRREGDDNTVKTSLAKHFGNDFECPDLAFRVRFGDSLEDKSKFPGGATFERNESCSSYGGKNKPGGVDDGARYGVVPHPCSSGGAVREIASIRNDDKHNVICSNKDAGSAYVLVKLEGKTNCEHGLRGVGSSGEILCRPPPPSEP